MAEVELSRAEEERRLIEDTARRLFEHWYQADELRLILLAGSETQKNQLRQADLLYHSALLSLQFDQRRRAVRCLVAFQQVCRQVFAPQALDLARQTLEQQMC